MDPLTGYRYYTPGQVLRLHRILVLRDLGVPLAQIGRLIDDAVTVEQLRGILRLRQAEARAQLAAQTEQLARVEIRLAQLEEGPMADYEVIVKRLEPLRVVALSENLAGVEEIGEACSRMYPRLHAALAQHRVGFDGLSLALYEDTDDEDLPLRLTTALPVPGGVTIEGDGLATIDLPAVERAATTVVRGSPDRFPDAFRTLHEWIDRAGEQATSSERELYIDCDGPPETWVTELQAVLETDRNSAQGADQGLSYSHAERRTEQRHSLASSRRHTADQALLRTFATSHGPSADFLRQTWRRCGRCRPAQNLLTNPAQPTASPAAPPTSARNTTNLRHADGKP